MYDYITVPTLLTEYTTFRPSLTSRNTADIVRTMCRCMLPYNIQYEAFTLFTICIMTYMHVMLQYTEAC